MHSLKHYVLLISFIVVVAAAEKEDKEKSQDMLRSGSSYAAVQSGSTGPSNCDIVAKFLAAYANNAKVSSDSYSATAPNYASQIAALYGVMNAAQNHAAHHGSNGYSSSSSLVKPTSGYSATAPTTSYSSGASGYSASTAAPASSYSSGGSSYSSSSSAVKPVSGYSAPTSGYSAPAPAKTYSSGGSSYSSSSSTAKPASGYSAPTSGYSAPASGYSAPASGYSAPASGYSATTSDYSAPASGYSAPAPAKTYSSGGSSYSSSSPSSYSAYSAPSSYMRFSDIARYMANDGRALNFADLPIERNYYSNQPQQAYGMNSFYAPGAFGFENERSGTAAVQGTKESKANADGAATSALYSDEKPQTPTKSVHAIQPASTTGAKATSFSVPQSYSRFGNDATTNYRSSSYGGSSASYDNAEHAVPVPVCAQNYLLSCGSSVQAVPCVQQQPQGNTAKY